MKYQLLLLVKYVCLTNPYPMYNQHKVFRVFELLRLLRTVPYFTPNELAEKMEVSSRSAYRYLSLVEQLGYPLQKDERGAYFIHTDYVEIPLSMKELELISNWASKEVDLNPVAKSLLKRIQSIPAVPPK